MRYNDKWSVRFVGTGKVYSRPDLIFSIVEHRDDTERKITFQGKTFKSVDDAMKYVERKYFNG